MEIYHDDYEPIPNVNRYQTISTLGEGTFGEVKKAYDTYTQRIVAIKYIRLLSKKNGLPKAIFREIESLKQLSDSIFIVKLENVYALETSIAMVMEYVESNLQELIHQSQRSIPRKQLQLFNYMMLASVNYCHENHIIHRDIKPSNFLLTSYGTIKLADFGLARIFNPQWSEEKLSHQVSTRQYRAPELLFASRRYNEKVDIWSTAVVMIELITLKTLFPSYNDIDQMSKVFQVIGSPTVERWPEVEQLPDYGKVSFPDFEPVPLNILLPMAHPDDIAFIEHFFQLNPAHRMSTKEGLALPYLSDVHNALAASISSNKGDSVATSFYLNNLYLTSPGTPFDTANLPSTSAKPKKEKIISSVEEFLAIDPFQP